MRLTRLRTYDICFVSGRGMEGYFREYIICGYRRNGDRIGYRCIGESFKEYYI